MKKPAPAATRKARHLRVPVLPAEEAQIKRLAAAAGLIDAHSETDERE